MKFDDYRYERPDVEKFKQDFNALLKDLNDTSPLEVQKASVTAINKLRNEFDTMQTLVSVRHSINTTDEFYKAEQEFMDEIGPVVQEYITDYYKALVHSKYRAEFEKEWGAQLLQLAEVSLRTFSPEIIEDLQLENKLSTEYSQLIASAKILFEGEERTLPQLAPFELSTDRDMRKSASEARFGFMSEHETEFDRIYDELVKVRDRIAKKLGYSNFVQLGYDRMMRTDYNAEMVANFRKQVLEYIVPVSQQLKKRQTERLGLDELKYYDENFSFKTGNATPKGDPDWIVANGKKMYKELSPETDEFFTFMLDNNLVDLVSKKENKAADIAPISANTKPLLFSQISTEPQGILMF